MRSNLKPLQAQHGSRDVKEWCFFTSTLQEQDSEILGESGSKGTTSSTTTHNNVVISRYSCDSCCISGVKHKWIPWICNPHIHMQIMDNTIIYQKILQKLKLHNSTLRGKKNSEMISIFRQQILASHKNTAGFLNFSTFRSHLICSHEILACSSC